MNFIKNLASLNLKRPLAAYKIFNKVALFFVYFYRYSLSYFFGGRCRFYPSCSEYALECYEQFNFIKSSQLVLIRLIKCHPFSKTSGYDPVPIIHEGKKI